MSGTPKRTIASVDGDLARKLEREHQHDASQRLSVWQEWIRAKEIKSLHYEIRAGHLKQLEDLLTGNASALHADAFSRLREECGALGAKLDAAKSADEFLSGLREITAISERMDCEIARKQEDDVRAVQDALQAVALELQGIEVRLGMENESERQGLDAEGAAFTQAALSRAREALSAGRRDSAKTLAADARLVAERHLATVREERLRRQEADKVADHIEAMVSGLQRDAVIERWCSEEVRCLENEASRARSIAAKGDMAAILRLSNSVRVRAGEIRERAESKERANLQKAHIVGQLQQTLTSMGLSVRDTRYENADDPRSAVRMSVSQVNGRQMAIHIDPSGSLEITVDKRSIRTELRGSEVVATCDAAEQTLEEMQRRLTAAGIQTTPLEWDGKPATAVSKAGTGDATLPRRAAQQREKKL